MNDICKLQFSHYNGICVVTFLSMPEVFQSLHQIPSQRGRNAAMLKYNKCTRAKCCINFCSHLYAKLVHADAIFDAFNPAILSHYNSLTIWKSLIFSQNNCSACMAIKISRQLWKAVPYYCIYELHVCYFSVCDMHKFSFNIKVIGKRTYWWSCVYKH